jgi:HK97 family phage major capsid protein
MDPKDFLKSLEAERAAASKRLTAILETAGADNKRALTVEETVEFDALLVGQESLSERISKLSAQITRDDELKSREDQAAAEITRQKTAPAVVTHEDGPYNRESSRNGGASYFRDLWRAGKGDYEASQRLQKNNKHREANDKTRAISTTTGAGGEFVPPLWLEEDFVPLARAGRITADLTTKDRLPAGTNSINIPKVATGATVAAQGTQNTAISNTDITTTSVASSVYTAAGGQTLSLQLIEQSPLNVDRVVLADLAKAYGIVVDNWVISGTGTAQPQGILSLTGRQTDQNTTQALLNAAGAGVTVFKMIANQIAAIQTSRFDAPTCIVMHPRRWYWFVSQVDGSNRPLVVPHSLGVMNALGSADNMNVTQGMVGEMLGLPVYVDPNIPTNLPDAKATPTTVADAIIVGKFDDAWLWEGTLKSQAFEQTFAQNLSLFVRLYNYVSFQPSRYPASFGVVNKLTDPTYSGA